MNNFLILDLLHCVAFQRAVASHCLSQNVSTVLGSTDVSHRPFMGRWINNLTLEDNLTLGTILMENPRKRLGLPRQTFLSSGFFTCTTDSVIS